MNEIELKFKIQDYNNIYQKLLQFGCIFKGPVVQRDEIYSIGDNTNLEINPGTSVIRVRTLSNVKKILTLKQRKVQAYACREIELEIENSEKIYEFIEFLGFSKIIDFTKERIYTTYGNFNVCIDRVYELGDYIEIEVLTNTENIEYIKDEILRFAEKLNLDETQIECRYYPQIILSERNGDEKQYDKTN